MFLSLTHWTYIRTLQSYCNHLSTLFTKIKCNKQTTNYCELQTLQKPFLGFNPSGQIGFKPFCIFPFISVSSLPGCLQIPLFKFVLKVIFYQHSSCFHILVCFPSFSVFRNCFSRPAETTKALAVLPSWEKSAIPCMYG